MPISYAFIHYILIPSTIGEGIKIGAYLNSIGPYLNLRQNKLFLNNDFVILGIKRCHESISWKFVKSFLHSLQVYYTVIFALKISYILDKAGQCPSV